MVVVAVATAGATSTGMLALPTATSVTSLYQKLKP
jgi:hypothetical protein